MGKPKRVALIGLDAAVRKIVEGHIANGHLPNITKLIKNGTICVNSLVPYPTITPPNWTTMATGAWPGTHGVTDFWKHLPGTTPDNSNILQAFSRDDNKSETIWDSLDKIGKKCIVLNYPLSWPSRLKNGIVVGGAGLAVGNSYIDCPFGGSFMSLSADMIISDRVYPKVIRGPLKKAEGWKNLTNPGDDPLESTVEMNFPSAAVPIKKTVWHVLVRDTQGDGYDEITLSPEKDFSKAFCTLKHREWSKHVYHTFQTESGPCEGVFMVKAENLPEEGEGYKLFITAILQTSGWSSPPEIAAMMRDNKGIPGNFGGFFANLMSWIDDETWLEGNLQHCQWNGDAAVKLMKSCDWDLFYMHNHPPDWMYHKIMNDLCPTTTPSPEAQAKAEYHDRMVWTYLDDILGDMMEAAGPETMFILVSDHGATTDGPTLDPYDILVNAGLAVRGGYTDNKYMDMMDEKAESTALMRKFKSQSQIPILSESKAIPQRTAFIYVNLKGRDPGGIVEPEDYEKVQQEIIDALYTYKHPETGERMVALALTKRDARMIGLYGDHVGDVIFAVNPKYSSQHGPILTTAEYGVGSVSNFLVFSGPGIKKGLRLERTAWLTDLVPTICDLMDWPVPQDCEGAILYQMLDK